MNAEAGRRHALLIFARTFDDESLRDLSKSSEEVDMLARVLADPEIGAFTVEQLIDRPCRDIQVAIARACQKAGREDVLVIYYSGHGIVDDNGRLFLGTRDSELEI